MGLVESFWNWSGYSNAWNKRTFEELFLRIGRKEVTAGFLCVLHALADPAVAACAFQLRPRHKRSSWLPVADSSRALHHSRSPWERLPASTPHAAAPPAVAG